MSVFERPYLRPISLESYESKTIATISMIWSENMVIIFPCMAHHFLPVIFCTHRRMWFGSTQESSAIGIKVATFSQKSSIIYFPQPLECRSNPEMLGQNFTLKGERNIYQVMLKNIYFVFPIIMFVNMARLFTKFFLMTTETRRHSNIIILCFNVSIRNVFVSLIANSLSLNHFGFKQKAKSNVVYGVEVWTYRVARIFFLLFNTSLAIFFHRKLSDVFWRVEK